MDTISRRLSLFALCSNADWNSCRQCSLTVHHNNTLSTLNCELGGAQGVESKCIRLKVEIALRSKVKFACHQANSTSRHLDVSNCKSVDIHLTAKFFGIYCIFNVPVWGESLYSGLQKNTDPINQKHECDRQTDRQTDGRMFTTSN